MKFCWHKWNREYIVDNGVPTYLISVCSKCKKEKIYKPQGLLSKLILEGWFSEESTYQPIFNDAFDNISDEDLVLLKKGHRMKVLCSVGNEYSVTWDGIEFYFTLQKWNSGIIRVKETKKETKKES